MELAANQASLSLETLAFKVDRKRIKTHLRLVEKSIRKNIPNDLSAAQLKARGTTLDRLHAYWQSEEFPINTVSKKRTPIFKDQFGNYCAVGYLLSKSGHDGYVSEIKSHNNLIKVKDISQPEYINAIAMLGITQEEAALIQPGYGYGCSTFNDCTTAATNTTKWSYWLVAAGVVYVLLQLVSLLFFRRMNMTRGQKVLGFLSLLLISSLVMMSITLMVSSLNNP
jgi:hypothetical protein